jgi:hypothetical protein
MPPERLTLLDFSDREFLLVVEDACDADGVTTSHEIAVVLDMTETHAPSMVASRLIWLARWGAVERVHTPAEGGAIVWHDADGKRQSVQQWRVTEAGRMLAHGKLRKATENALERVDDDQMLVLTRWLARRSTGAVALRKG